MSFAPLMKLHLSIVQNHNNDDSKDICSKPLFVESVLTSKWGGMSDEAVEIIPQGNSINSNGESSIVLENNGVINDKMQVPTLT
eukprot:1668693-Amphidinium_carterae.1